LSFRVCLHPALGRDDFERTSRPSACEARRDRARSARAGRVPLARRFAAGGRRARGRSAWAAGGNICAGAGSERDAAMVKISDFKLMCCPYQRPSHLGTLGRSPWAIQGYGASCAWELDLLARRHFVQDAR
jgi:hypothetical protein